MKQFINFIAIILIAISFQNCTSVPAGHKGVKVKWGGETDTTQVYDEGMYVGLSWLWNDMVKYDCRERTLTQDYEFNDANNMTTGVEIALDWNLERRSVNLLHKTIADVEIKLEKTLKSAAKEVIPQYTAVELNITKRQEAENKLSAIVAEELPEFYCVFQRVQITDVDIPATVSKLAEQTAEQIEKNKLAQEKEAEEIALANARIAKAKGDFEAAEYESKAKELLSRPAMLDLKKLDIQMEWAKKGVSPYGNNNVFGDGVSTLKLLGQ